MAGRADILKKIVEGRGAIDDLVRALRMQYGNKVYMRDLEVLLSSLNLSPRDEQTIYYLIRDIKGY